MNILEAIKERRNIKVFKKDPVNQDQLLTWLEAATMAPNHRLTEPWEVYLVGPETRAKLNHKTDFGGAPMLIAVLSRHGATPIETEENRVATSCFIQNFNLAAWAEGVGTFWSSLGATPKNREYLEVPENYDVVALLGVGYPAEIRDPKPRTPIQNKLKQLS